MGASEDGSRDVEAAVEPPPQLDLYEPLLEKEKVYADGNGNNAMKGTHHVAMIGTKVAPIESLDFE